MTLNLYFLRHGQTEFSRENNFCGSGLNPDLTDDGKNMANAFAEHYASKKWEAIYSSSLNRAIQTATPISHLTKIDIRLSDELKEISYGEWEGKTVEYIDKEFHDDYIKWSADPAWYPPTGGETAIGISNRALQAIEEIKNKFNDGNVLIVSHKATIRIIISSLLGIDVGRFRYRFACPVGSVSIIEFGKNGPLLKTLADRSHQSEYLRNLPGT
ncbi:MAG: histidine phosphatase family protein [Candidatus Sericytochromatia bacterium]|nr:histidine phosphatase family protein [Candidatus Sericytochromatia bacterium]